VIEIPPCACEPKCTPDHCCYGSGWFISHNGDCTGDQTGDQTGSQCCFYLETYCSCPAGDRRKKNDGVRDTEVQGLTAEQEMDARNNEIRARQEEDVSDSRRARRFERDV
jgi:hypothetical protein